jgi:hypothetical protein
MNHHEPKIITDTLAQLEAAERDPEHPRSLARAAIKRWRSDADREALPVTNIVDSGAPLLDRDAVVRASYPNHANRKA